MSTAATAETDDVANMDDLHESPAPSGSPVRQFAPPPSGGAPGVLERTMTSGGATAPGVLERTMTSGGATAPEPLECTDAATYLHAELCEELTEEKMEELPVQADNAQKYVDEMRTRQAKGESPFVLLQNTEASKVLAKSTTTAGDVTIALLWHKTGDDGQLEADIERAREDRYDFTAAGDPMAGPFVDDQAHLHKIYAGDRTWVLVEDKSADGPKVQ